MEVFFSSFLVGVSIGCLCFIVCRLLGLPIEFGIGPALILTVVINSIFFPSKDL